MQYYTMFPCEHITSGLFAVCSERNAHISWRIYGRKRIALKKTIFCAHMFNIVIHYSCTHQTIEHCFQMVASVTDCFAYSIVQRYDFINIFFFFALLDSQENYSPCEQSPYMDGNSHKIGVVVVVKWRYIYTTLGLWQIHPMTRFISIEFCLLNLFQQIGIVLFFSNGSS